MQSNPQHEPNKKLPSTCCHLDQLRIGDTNHCWIREIRNPGTEKTGIPHWLPLWQAGAKSMERNPAKAALHEVDSLLCRTPGNFLFLNILLYGADHISYPITTSTTVRSCSQSTLSVGLPPKIARLDSAKVPTSTILAQIGGQEASLFTREPQTGNWMFLPFKRSWVTNNSVLLLWAKRTQKHKVMTNEMWHNK